MNINSASVCLKRVSRSRKQIKHFVWKPTPFQRVVHWVFFWRWGNTNCNGPHTINAANVGSTREIPFGASILFFTVTCAYSLLLKKKGEYVNSLHWFGNLFLFERIQQGYDLNPEISVRFGTSANHRIPFLKLHEQCCTIFCRWLAYFKIPSVKTEPKKKISIDGLSELSVFFVIEKIIIYFNFWMWWTRFEETLFWTVFSTYSTESSPTWRYFTCSYIYSPSTCYSQRP